MNRRNRSRLSLIPLALALVLAGPLVGGESSYDELRIALKQDLLRQVNRDRAAHGLAPVQLDPQSSALADDYCAKQIRWGTTGHFTIDGLAPYMRYSLAGGNDGLSENTAAWSANYRFSDAAVADLISRSQQTMMAELPPHDGHRRAILDPAATHVGIGLSWEGGELRIAQEFLRRYIEWSRPVPRTASPGDRTWIAGKPIPGFRIEAISVHYEESPKPLAAATANRITGYTLPQERRDYLPRAAALLMRTSDRIEAVRYERNVQKAEGEFSVERDGSFSFHVPLDRGPGVYTVVVWVRGPAGERPISASNVSIRVAPGAGAGAGSHLSGR